MYSIRVKIIAVTIAAILASVLVLGGIGMIKVKQESERSSVERMSTTCMTLQQKLNVYLGSLEQSVQMGIHIAEDSLEGMDMALFSSSLTAEQKEQLDTALEAHTAEVEHAFSSIAENTQGVVTYYYCINDDLGSSEHGFFLDATQGNGFIRRDPLISSELDLNDTEHTTWYYSPVKGGRPMWIGPYKAHFLNEALTVSYVAPIYCYGFLLGVLGMDILFETLVDQIRDVHVYDTGIVFLTDKDGTILYHPTLESGINVYSLNQTADRSLLKRTSSGDEMIRFDFDGVEKQLAFTTLRNKIKLGISARVSEISANLHQIIRIIVFSVLGLTAIFSVIALLLVRAFTKPLRELSVASQRLADGDYDVELNYQGQDEVGTLTRAFTQMRDTLKMHISDLNSKAYSDALTGVKNKAAFNIATARLNNEIRTSPESSPPEFAVVAFDCNGLKKINDEHGHEFGDLYLQAACSLICRVFAHSPVFRLGGDEFETILQQTDYENRYQLMTEFDRAAAKENSQVKYPWERVNVAKGLAEYLPGTDWDFEAVYSRADGLMYEDKRKNR